MSALQDQRTALLVGDDGVARLRRARVAVFGLGGVGSAAAEALVRAGVGTLVLVDNDVVSESNINRQLIALHSTVGRKKAQVMADRARDIRPDVNLEVRPVFFSADTAGAFDFPQYDYVVDAIDTVSAKVELICQATAAGTPIISCMGAGNKLDPTRFCVTDLSKTQMCPLARVMRQRLRQNRCVWQAACHRRVAGPSGLPSDPAGAGMRKAGGIPQTGDLFAGGRPVYHADQRQF